ncbi:MAG TPA: phage holin family protein [Dehalococcoidia bacterium]|nr:phage holin family protein [Dehalococcoidia bacterium]
MRRDRFIYWQWRRPQAVDYGLAGMIVRFVVTVAALWIAQWLVRGFDIDSAGALVFGAIVFGVVNAIIRPIIAFVTCLLTILTLGLFTLIVNTMMLGLTAWFAGLFDVEFHVDGFIAAFLGALVISVISTVLNWWATRNVLGPLQTERYW